MSEPPFLPDNFLSRLDKQLTSGSTKKAVERLGADFGDVSFLARHYVAPSGQAKKPMADKPGETRAAFSTINRFLGPDVGSGLPHHRRNCLFLLGDTGLGKTSVLLMLRVAKLTGISPSPYACVLRTLRTTTLKELGEIPTPGKTILLLDALNESPEASPNLIGYVNALLEATQAFHRVIVACRTGYFSERQDMTTALGAFVSGGYRCPTLYLLPFSEAQADKYLKQRFQRMKDPQRNRVKTLIRGLGELRDRPLFFHHADDLSASQQASWNPWTTYETIVQAWLEREQRQGKAVKLSIDSMLDSCIRLAQGLALGEPLPLEVLTDIEPLECQGRSLLRRYSKSDVRFIHKSFQEYLIALGLRGGTAPAGKRRLPTSELVLSFLVHNDDARTAWRAMDLVGRSFEGVELRAPDFSKADLSNTRFGDSRLHGASFDHALLNGWAAERASIDSASFQGAKATRAKLHAANFTSTSFTHSTAAESILTEARFEDCQLHHMLFADADLRGSYFSRSTLKECSLKGADLRGTTFEHCTLEKVNLQASDFRGAALDRNFLDAINSGTLTHWKTAAWDPEMASRLKLSPQENEANARAIENP